MLAIFLIFFSLTFSALAQDSQNQVAPVISDARLTSIPSAKDDQETQKLLINMAKKAKWFPKIQLKVDHGILLIEGEAQNAAQLKWLSKTAEKLPTIIAVINRAQVETPPLFDMSPFFSELKRLQSSAKRHIPLLVIASAMFIFFIWAGSRVYQGLQILWGRRITNPFMSSTIAKLTMIPIWLMFFYLTLMAVGLQSLAATIIGGTGVLGIVIGFAFKDIAENYLSGILLAIRSPFTKGDHIRVDDQEGIVQNLNMRGTTIMDSDGNLILIPNTMVIQSIVKNFTVNEEKRSSFTLGVGYGDSIETCQTLIQDALKDIEGIIKSPDPLVVAEGFGTSTINLKVYFWYNRVSTNEGLLKTMAISKTKETLLSHGISLPDEAREVIFSDALKIKMIENEDEMILKNENSKRRATENLVKIGTSVSIGNEHDEKLQQLAKKTSFPNQKPQDDLLKVH